MREAVRRATDKFSWESAEFQNPFVFSLLMEKHELWALCLHVNKNRFQWLMILRNKKMQEQMTVIRLEK